MLDGEQGLPDPEQACEIAAEAAGWGCTPSFLQQVVIDGRLEVLLRLRERALERVADASWELVAIAFAVLEREVRRDG